MKYLFYTFLAVITISCNKESPDVTTEEEVETQVICENDAFQITIEANGITMTSDNCWLIYTENAPTVEGNLAVLKWEYPGYPDWNGANSIAFDYPTATAEPGTYEANDFKGVIQFDGSNGEMFTGLGEDSITITVDESNAETEYICGSLEGKALLNDVPGTNVKASFKAVLKPQ